MHNKDVTNYINMNKVNYSLPPPPLKKARIPLVVLFFDISIIQVVSKSLKVCHKICNVLLIARHSHLQIKCQKTKQRTLWLIKKCGYR